MPTTRETLEEHTWIKAPSVETWISCPPLNGIPFKNLYIESMLVLLYKYCHPPTTTQASPCLGEFLET